MSHKHPFTFALAASLCALSTLACSTALSGQSKGAEFPETSTRVLDLAQLSGMDRLLDRLADRRVIFVGESHDRYEDHLNQLAIIQGLHARGKPLVIGMEFFQQPFQPALDDYIAGTLDEAEFLRRTQYFDRWRYDYRLYRPILRFAREQRIPVIALNLESELTRRVGEVGIAGLSTDERARIPTGIDRADPAYRARLEAVFKQHPGADQRNIEHFVEVQLMWDEGMADRAAQALAAHPDRTLVVLAGSGHLEYGQGIPKRLLRRVDVPSAIVLNGADRDLDPAVADFLLFPKQVDLPAAGLLGVMLDQTAAGEGMLVQGFAEKSGAKAAGIVAGDRILRIGTQPIASYADIRIALLDSQPGQTLPVEVQRKGLVGADERLTFLVELH
ncbi:putative iron-regulated protein [Thiobaca trueperi]|uniref:Putative iron-regulated protein n=1 Tax=Thiobaca trueperi TaxID=127458 RepID=A0A4R3N0I0_9GAMM|nr:putative iron-regulated protein [Thiobaca trueperi]